MNEHADLPKLSPQAFDAGHAIVEAMRTCEDRLRQLDPVILDLSIREPAVGVARGHTVADKIALLELVREAGFRDILLATFDVSLPDVPQVDDLFVQALIDRYTDLTGTFAFATIGRHADGKFVPDVSMEKTKNYGIPNVIVDIDIARWNLEISREQMVCDLVASIDWFAQNLTGDGGGAPRVYINYQDGVDAFFDDWEWIARLTQVLADQPAVTAVTFEDGKGTAFPFQIGAMTALIRGLLREDQLLLVHMHSGSGMENANLIEALFRGADGIWSGFTREAATIGHAPTSEFLANLARFKGSRVAAKYPLERFVPIAEKMTQINTLAPTPDDVPIVGRNAYRTMLTFFQQDADRAMDLPPERIGARAGYRITPVASDRLVIKGRLLEVAPGLSADTIADELLDRMRALMRKDLCLGYRFDYDEPHGLLDLYTRARALMPAAAPEHAGDRVLALPGLGPVAGAQFAGYASIGNQPEDAGLFYWFAGTEDYARRPTILWLNGGPGSTSFWGFFLANGPYEIDAFGTLNVRPKAWNETAGFLMFDQPLSVGLSFAKDGVQLPRNVQEGTDQLYQALVHFMARHPEIRRQPLILAGESYGGTYVPLLAKAILDGNASKPESERIQLSGTILASAWVSPSIQQGMDTTYAFAHGLITAADKEALDKTCNECQTAIAAETPSSECAYEVCGKLKSTIGEISGRYLYNLAQTGDPDTAPVTAYLSRADVREAIHAKPEGEFTFYSERIGKSYEIGGQDSYAGTVEEVLAAGVKVMVISGLNDAADVNFLGTGAWLNELSGDAAAAFKAAPATQWKPGEEVLGYDQDGGTLSWVKVLNAGHMAVSDQPRLIDLISEKLLK